jgi:hypothetical protein
MASLQARHFLLFHEAGLLSQKTQLNTKETNQQGLKYKWNFNLRLLQKIFSRWLKCRAGNDSIDRLDFVSFVTFCGNATAEFRLTSERTSSQRPENRGFCAQATLKTFNWRGVKTPSCFLLKAPLVLRFVRFC